MTNETVNSRTALQRAGLVAWFLLRWTAFLAIMGGLLAVVALLVGPRLLGWQGVVILSGSMEPTLNTGGIAFVEPKPAGKVKAGDILTFRRRQGQSSLITHRVVAIVDGENGKEFVTRGDANTDNDVATVLPKQVVGTVRFDLPYVGRAINNLRDRSSYYFFMGIPAALLVLNEMWTVAAEVQRNRRKGQQASRDIEGACS